MVSGYPGKTKRDPKCSFRQCYLFLWITIFSWKPKTVFQNMDQAWKSQPLKVSRKHLSKLKGCGHMEAVWWNRQKHELWSQTSIWISDVWSLASNLIFLTLSLLIVKIGSIIPLFRNIVRIKYKNACKINACKCLLNKW